MHPSNRLKLELWYELAHPQNEYGFICHLENHWFYITKVGGELYNFNSFYPTPEYLSKFYLSAYVDMLKGPGWSIFLVRGNFPRDYPLPSSETSNYYGQCLTADDAHRITKSVAMTHNVSHEKERSKLLKGFRDQVQVKLQWKLTRSQVREL